MALVNILSPVYMDRFAQRQQAPVEAVPTPLSRWNAMCRGDGGGVGLARGWFVIVGANPKHGKTNLALNMAATAVKAGHHVGIVSLEMSDPQLATRFYALSTDTHIRHLERGSFDSAHFEAMWNKKIDDRMLAVGDVMVESDRLRGVRDVVRAMDEMHDNGANWIIVDYLQLVSFASEDDMTRSVAEVAGAMRSFSMDKKCTVVGLSQFNRTTAGNYDQTPRCQGLHGGMILEGTAEQVVLLDHSRYERVGEGRYGRTWLVIDANRHGDSGDIPVEWDYRTMSIREASQNAADLEWPGRKAKPR